VRKKPSRSPARRDLRISGKSGESAKQQRGTALSVGRFCNPAVLLASRLNKGRRSSKRGGEDRAEKSPEVSSRRYCILRRRPAVRFNVESSSQERSRCFSGARPRPPRESTSQCAHRATCLIRKRARTATGAVCTTSSSSCLHARKFDGISAIPRSLLSLLPTGPRGKV
jgi:hypothetical protein